MKMAAFLFFWHLSGVKLTSNLLDLCGHLKPDVLKSIDAVVISATWREMKKVIYFRALIQAYCGHREKNRMFIQVQIAWKKGIRFERPKVVAPQV